MPQRNKEGASAAQADAGDIREGIRTSALLAEAGAVGEGIRTNPLLASAHHHWNLKLKPQLRK